MGLWRDQHRPFLRRNGRVTAYHPSGYSLCHGAWIETSIPIFPGMSGAPVMKLMPGGPILPFGVMSFDLQDDLAHKWDRSIAGHSIVPLIRPAVQLSSDGQRSTMLTLESGMMAGTGWSDGAD